MNKYIAYVAVAALGSMLSGAAFSATVWGETTQSEEVTGGVAGDCPLLSDTVMLGVSANAVGGYACDEATNLIQVAACHTGGSRQQGVACVDTDPLTPGDQLPDGCAAVGGNSTIPSFKAFFASSMGGVMAEIALDQRCTEAQLGAVSDWVN